MLIVQTSVKIGLVPLPLFSLLIHSDPLAYGLSVTMGRKFPIVEFLGSDTAEQAYVHGHP